MALDVRTPCVRWRRSRTWDRTYGRTKRGRRGGLVLALRGSLVTPRSLRVITSDSPPIVAGPSSYRAPRLVRAAPLPRWRRRRRRRSRGRGQIAIRLGRLPNDDDRAAPDCAARPPSGCALAPFDGELDVGKCHHSSSTAATKPGLKPR